MQTWMVELAIIYLHFAGSYYDISLEWQIYIYQSVIENNANNQNLHT